jgi:cell wall-associated NlpC family hydrolase
VSISPNDIIGVDNYPPEVRKLINGALALTTRNLGYKYGSADPDAGGMDCSGFIYYVLIQNGVKDVPRDASGQYSWVRKAGKFQAVISRNENTFELEELKPGDLLFWTGTYNVEKDPPITHTMIYLGREKKSNQRIMVGSSDGRVYHGESRFGVGVFDFKLSRSGGNREGRIPTFVGYGRIPGLGEG